MDEYTKVQGGWEDAEGNFISDDEMEALAEAAKESQEHEG